MANLIMKIGKGIEVAVEDVIKWEQAEQAIVIKAAPGTLAAIGLLATGVQKAIADAQGDTTLAGIITIPEQLADFKALWPEVKAVFEAMGLTKI